MSAPRPGPVITVRRRHAGDRRTLPLLRVPQLIELLKVQPELTRRPEDAAWAQRRVSGNGTANVYDFGDAAHRNLDPPAQLGRAHPEHVQVLAKLFAQMNGFARHVVLLLNGGRRFPHWPGSAARTGSPRRGAKAPPRRRQFLGHHWQAASQHLPTFSSHGGASVGAPGWKIANSRPPPPRCRRSRPAVDSRRHMRPMTPTTMRGAPAVGRHDRPHQARRGPRADRAGAGADGGGARRALHEGP